jgi:hypothetical protein
MTVPKSGSQVDVDEARVNLRGTNERVSHKGWKVSQISTILKHVGREAVPEHRRTDASHANLHPFRGPPAESPFARWGAVLG